MPALKSKIREGESNVVHLDPSGQLTLGDLAVRINARHKDAVEAVGDVVNHAVAIGRDLRQAQREAKAARVRWEDWVTSNLEFTDRQARKYLRMEKRNSEAVESSVFPRDAGEAEDATRAVVGAKTTQRGASGTGENEWFTPQEWIERARTVLGEFDVDPASSKLANKTVRADTFFDKDDDGLNRPWYGRVWLNPPYAQPFIAQFAEKMVKEHQGGNVDAAIMLTHNYTDNAWWQLLGKACAALCFPRGRVKFYSPTGKIAAPTQGQTFFYFGNDVKKFAEVFGEIGTVLKHYNGQLNGAA